MNEFKKILENLSDVELKEAILELIADEDRNDGIIESKWVRKIAKEFAKIAGDNPIFLTTASICLYQEGCRRFIHKL